MPVLPPTLAWTLGTVAAVMVVKLVIKEWQRVNDELDRMKRAPVKVEPDRRTLPTLRRDPISGQYRLR